MYISNVATKRRGIGRRLRILLLHSHKVSHPILCLLSTESAAEQIRTPEYAERFFSRLQSTDGIGIGMRPKGRFLLISKKQVRWGVPWKDPIACRRM